MRIEGLFSCAAVLVLSAPAIAQTSPVTRHPEYRFAIIWPAAPKARDISYVTKDGASVPARQLYVEQSGEQFVVTVVNLPNGPAVDDQAVQHAADQLRARGEVRFQYDDAYDPGVPGRQLNMVEPNGLQLRASMYMWDRYLIIAVASAAPGSSAALQFEQSLTLLDAAGDEVNTGQDNTPFSAQRR